MHEISKAFTAGVQSIASSSLQIISSNILRERRMKRARVLRRMAFPGGMFTRDQVVTFQWKRAFHVQVLARAWYCSNHPMRRSRPQEISIFEKASRHTGDYVGKKLKTLPF